MKYQICITLQYEGKLNKVKCVNLSLLVHTHMSMQLAIINSA